MLPSTMKTIEVREAGGPDVLEIGERPISVPENNQVLVRVTASGVNGPDLLQRRGHYPPPPDATDLLGLEVSGEVVRIGSEVRRWSVGDKVCALTHGGGYAEYVAINADHCLPIPEGIAELDAAGIPETFYTVWNNFFLNGNVVKGDRFLVHGGAGGIGTTAIQLGNAFGADVYTTVSTQDNASFCENLGAVRAINYREEDFVEVMRAAGGANVILDIVGGEYIARNIKAASADALIVQLAFNQGSKVEADLMPVMLKRLTLTGSTLRSRAPEFKARVAVDLENRVWPLFDSGKIKTLTHIVLPFDQVADAHRMMEAKQHRGKILLTPNG
ncbi:MAG: NAD(P)H-quinone oxidoreductase [Pseudomonadota bacterium]